MRKMVIESNKVKDDFKHKHLGMKKAIGLAVRVFS
jgi:hypothetical protein